MVGRSPLPLAIAAGFWLVSPGGAEAHAALVRASPRVGAAVAASPAEVRMWFSEALEPAFSQASILAGTARTSLGAKAFVDPNDRRQLVAPVPRPLPPGRYQVKWAVVSVDGHRTEGDFRFTVKPGR